MPDPAPTPQDPKPGEQAQGTEIKADPKPSGPVAEPSKPATPASDPAPTPPPTAEEQAKLRTEEALKKVESQNERVRKVLDLNSELVSEDPEIIHKVFKTDPDLANQIVEKLWGGVGLKSYKQLMERVKLEQVKVENPQLYETSKDVAEMKAKLEEKDRKERSTVKSRFLKSKSIVENEYDPNYKRLEESISLLNPSVVEADYESALEAAHKIAFASGRIPVEKEMPTMAAGGVAPSAVIPSSKAPVSEQSSWLAGELNKKFAYKIDLNK